LSSTTDTDNLLQTGQAEATTPDTANVTFANDSGTLLIATRRVLVQLLQGPAVDGRRQTKLWPILLRDESVLRSRLHELFLELVIDHDQKVAFTRQVVAESIDAPILLRRATLTFLESALILFLRQRITHAEAQGERAVVAKDEMLEHLQVYERDKNVDRARFERQMESAVEKAKKLSLLHKIRGSEDRFEVSPTLKLLFPAEEIIALTHTYEAIAQAASYLNQGEVADAESTDEPPPEDGGHEDE
jgi:hypothetical protein